MIKNVFAYLCREENPELGLNFKLPYNSDTKNEEDK